MTDNRGGGYSRGGGGRGRGYDGGRGRGGSFDGGSGGRGGGYEGGGRGRGGGYDGGGRGRGGGYEGGGRGCGGGYDGGGRGGPRGGRGRGGAAPVMQASGPVTLASNHFPISILPSAPKLHKYRVEIRRADTSVDVHELTIRKKEELRRRVVDYALAREGKSLHKPADGLAFDGDHILISKNKLKTASAGEPLYPYGQRVGYICTFSDEGQIDLTELNRMDKEHLTSANVQQVLDILLSTAACLDHDPMGRGRYISQHEPPRPLHSFPESRDARKESQGRFLAIGHVQKSALTKNVQPNGRISLNWSLEVNAASQACFPDIPLIEYIELLMGTPITRVNFSSGYTVGLLNKELQNTILYLNHYGADSHRTKTFGMIDHTKNSKTYTFEVSDSKEKPKMVNVKDYFKSRYGVTLKYDELPLVSPKPLSRSTFFPMEVVTIARQKMMKKLDTKVKSVIGSVMTMDPGTRKDHLQKTIKELTSENAVLREFSIKIDTEMLDVKGEVLERPVLQYGKRHPDPDHLPVNCIAPPRQDLQLKKPGQWTVGNAGVGFCETHGARYLGIINIGHPVNRTQDFFMTLVEEAKKYNIKISGDKPALLEVNRFTNDKMRDFPQFRKEFQSVILGRISELKQKNMVLSFIICLMDERSDPIYQLIKETLDPVVPTQVLLKPKTPVLNGTNKSVELHYSNILAKINQKLGGGNQTISPSSSSQIFRKVLGSGNDVLILGADVTHPAVTFGKSKFIPSMTALVGSTDGAFQHIHHAVSAQKAGLEVIANLKDLVTTIVTKASKNSQWPKKVLYFRDGCSDGSMEMVKNEEIKEITAAFHNANQPLPQIAYILIQKHHQTRFFPKSTQDARENCPPGTLVKDNLTNPSKFRNFYLIAQHGIKGTSNPCRYYVMEDQLNIDDKDWGHLCYQLSHCFGRAMKSIAVAAPIRYASLLADRCRFLAAETILSETGHHILTDDASSVVTTENKNAKMTDLNPTEADFEIDRILNAANNKLQEITESARPLFYV